MFVDLSVVGRRYQAVLAVIRDGEPVVDVEHHFEVPRQANETRYWQLIIEHSSSSSTNHHRALIIIEHCGLDLAMHPPQ
jgi:hypothetical protein